MEKTLPYRVVRLEGDVWTIRSDGGELGAEEQRELKAYLDHVQLPSLMHNGQTCVPGSIAWELLYEKLTQFYAGRAELIPF